MIASNWFKKPIGMKVISQYKQNMISTNIVVSVSAFIHVLVYKARLLCLFRILNFTDLLQ